MNDNTSTNSTHRYPSYAPPPSAELVWEVFLENPVAGTQLQLTDDIQYTVCVSPTKARLQWVLITQYARTRKYNRTYLLRLALIARGKKETWD